MEDFKFSTLEYKRPDFEKTGAFAEEITEKIKNAASYGELKGYICLLYTSDAADE